MLRGAGWRISILGAALSATVSLNLWASGGSTTPIMGTWVLTAVNNPDGRLTGRSILAGRTFQIDASGRLFSELQQFSGIIAENSFNETGFSLTDTYSNEKFSVVLSSNKQTLAFTSQRSDTFEAQRTASQAN
jgi:hypothetical protein